MQAAGSVRGTGLLEQMWGRSHSWQHEYDRTRGVYRRPVLDEPMAMTCKIKAFHDGRLEGVVRWTDLQRVLNACDPWVKRRGPRMEPQAQDGEVIERARRRARQAVRDWCLRAHADRMATFGTRAAILFDTLLKRWDRFRRYYWEALHRDWERVGKPRGEPEPQFVYCAVPEPHTGEMYTKRGLTRPVRPENGRPHYHLHVALRGTFRLDLALPIWHALCAGDFPNGVASGSKCHGSINIKVFHARRASEDVYSVIANYIAKYVGKSLEAAFNRKKYWASRVPPAQVNQVILRSRDWLECQRELSERFGLDWTSLLITHEGCIFVLPDDKGLWFKCPPEMYRSVPDL